MVYYFLSLFTLFITFLISSYNFFFAPRIERVKPGKFYGPLVSVLIPARNEEKNIKKCLDSIFSGTYKNIEVIVYNDQSDDLTLEILEDYSKDRGGLRVINGKGLPQGWTGKNWACDGLYKSSKGDILLFCDADVTLSDGCIEKAVSCVIEKQLGLLSCFPFQKMMTPGEWLIVPLMNWILLSLLPVYLVYRSSRVSLAAANGQFMLFDRDAYEAVGGHEGVRSQTVEDVALSKKMKAINKKVMTCITATEVTCRMYYGYKDSLSGFEKNFFRGSGMSLPVFSVFVLWLFSVFAAPVFMVFSDTAYLLHVLLIVLIRISVSVASGQNPLKNMVLHPAQMVMMVLIGVRSAWASATGRVYWKGRKI